MAVQTSLRCRVCGKIMGKVRDFQGKVFTLCPACEKALKEAKKRRPREN